MRGVGNRAPFFQTRTSPFFSAMKMRPPGAKAKLVGRSRPETTVSIVNPASGAAARLATLLVLAALVSGVLFAANPTGWTTSPTATPIKTTRPLLTSPLPDLETRIPTLGVKNAVHTHPMDRWGP